MFVCCAYMYVWVFDSRLDGWMDGWMRTYTIGMRFLCKLYIRKGLFFCVFSDLCIYDFTHATVFKAVFCRALHMMYCTGAMLTRTSALGFGV